MRRALAAILMLVGCGARTGLGVTELQGEAPGDSGIARGRDGGSKTEAGIQDGGASCPRAPTPVTLADFGVGTWVELAQDDAYVYWTTTETSYTVRRVSKCGGPMETLASAQPYPSAIAVDATTVYFASGASGSVKLRSVPKAGGPTTDLADLAGVRWLTVDGATLFASSYAAGLVSVPTSGGAVTTLAPGIEGSIAVDATFVYAHALSDVVAIARSGGAAKVLAPSPPQGGVVVDGANVLYSGWVTSSDGFVRSVTAAGGAPASLAEGLAEPVGIAFDAKYVYVAEQGFDIGTGRVTAIPRSGGGSQTLATAQDRPEGIIADATSLYWLNFGGQVMKLDNPN